MLSEGIAFSIQQSKISISPSLLPNLEPASGVATPLAALLDGRADHVREPASDALADRRMRTRERGEGTRRPNDGEDAVALDVRSGTKMCVHQVAGLRDARTEVCSRPFSGRETARESLADPPKQRLKLFRR